MHKRMLLDSQKDGLDQMDDYRQIQDIVDRTYGKGAENDAGAEN